MTNAKIRKGDVVRCNAGDIDKKQGEGMVGRVNGFARLSSHHGREAFVVFDGNPKANGWFWVRDLEAAQ